MDTLFNNQHLFNEGHIYDSILAELNDHENAIVTPSDDGQEDVVMHVEGSIHYWNRILNTATFDCLVSGGLYLNLYTNIQTVLATLYIGIKMRNEMLFKLNSMMNLQEQKDFNINDNVSRNQITFIMKKISNIEKDLKQEITELITHVKELKDTCNNSPNLSKYTTKP